MGVALENARLFDETQRLLKETEQRSAELAVINSIQQGMAAELDFQAIVDLVGDKLREVLDTGDIGIALARRGRRASRHPLYLYEHGARLPARAVPPSSPAARSPAPWCVAARAARRPATGPSRRRSACEVVPGTDRSTVGHRSCRSWPATA